MTSLVIIIEGITFYFCQRNDEAANRSEGERGSYTIVMSMQIES